MKNQEQDELFNLSDQASDFLKDKRAGNDDGLLRPKIEEGKDGKRTLVIRILPNMMKSGKIGSTAIEKHIHYADFKGMPELAGYFDCLKNVNIGKSCSLCDAFWKLKKSNNPADVDKSKLINRSTKYYCYALVVEDKQKPENEGKIFIFPFGFKIFQKIKAMADSTRKPCKVEDLVYGANLELNIEEVGGYVNYDGSKFEAPEPITIDGKILEVDKDGNISKSEKARVVEFLKSRTHDLEDFTAVDWTPEQSEKANRVIAHLTGQSYSGTANVSMDSRAEKKAPLTSANVFDDDEEDEDEAEKTSKKTAKAETKVEKVEKTEVKSEKADLSAAKKKAASFFEDDED